MSVAQSFRLGPAPGAYDQRAEQELRAEMDRRDLLTHKKGRHLDLGGKDYYPILYDTVTGDRYKLTVVSGTLTITAL